MSVHFLNAISTSVTFRCRPPPPPPAALRTLRVEHVRQRLQLPNVAQQLPGDLLQQREAAHPLRRAAEAQVAPPVGRCNTRQTFRSGQLRSAQVSSGAAAAQAAPPVGRCYTQRTLSSETGGAFHNKSTGRCTIAHPHVSFFLQNSSIGLSGVPISAVTIPVHAWHESGGG